MENNTGKSLSFHAHPVQPIRRDKVALTADTRNDDQVKATEAMIEFLKAPGGGIFLLKGSAGTGKTFCVQYLRQMIKGRFIYTAPTNKATKVLRQTLTQETYRPQCKTIYSLLGLKIDTSGEIKEIKTPDEDVDLSQYLAVVLDEGSMVNKMLTGIIQSVVEEQGVKFIVMGDEAQLPPVKEFKPPLWDVADEIAELTIPMRFDNQILNLATNLRNSIGHPVPKFHRETDNDGDEGVWCCNSAEFIERIQEAARLGRFSNPDDAKAIAWRNARVVEMNMLVRGTIFEEDAAAATFLPTDRIIVTEPAIDSEDNKLAHTDDEGTVRRVEIDYHPVYTEMKIWVLSVDLDDNKMVTLRTLHGDSFKMYEQHAAHLAAEARANRRLWHLYWEFRQAFHSVRHGYALTAHRSQGSTYQAAYVDWRDILTNRNRQEAFRCLYVACTRAKKELYLGG